MAKEPSPQEAIERARRAMEDRLATVQNLAERRQSLADVRDQAAARIAQVEREVAEQVAAAEREDASAFAAAISAGWTDAELRKIGFTSPDKKKTPGRRRTARSATPPPSPSDPDSGSDDAGSE